MAKYAQRRRRRAADAGVTMHEHRALPVPFFGKIQKRPHVRGRGLDIAGIGRRHVVDFNMQMPRRIDPLGRFRHTLHAQ